MADDALTTQDGKPAKRKGFAMPGRFGGGAWERRQGPCAAQGSKWGSCLARAGFFRILEPFFLIAAPAALFACTFLQVRASAFLTLLMALASAALFFVEFEEEGKRLGCLMPVVVLSALAVAGRVLCVVFPGVQPVTAIAIIAGSTFGKRNGFMVGALSALVSNAFLGMGPWAAWQMYAWGLVGYMAGVFQAAGLLHVKPAVLAFGFAGSFVFGFLMNTWMASSLLHPFTWQAACALYAAGFVADAAHAAGTVVFLLMLYAPWCKKLERIKRKYAFL